MSRCFLLVIDSLGLGGAPDATSFGDTGADTLGHIADACYQGRGDNDRRQGPLLIPNLNQLGLSASGELSRGHAIKGLKYDGPILGAWGCANEQSRGKDTPSGHWEMAGLPVKFDWGVFPDTQPCFPPDIIKAWLKECHLPGILGDCHASGTEIIEKLGMEHLSSGKPICYTSADSVFQIAVHEDHFGLERLYEICAKAEQAFKPLNIGRIIARPFLGDSPETFKRTSNRRDLTVTPPGVTLLDRVFDAGQEVVSVGKIADIFAHRSITRGVKANTTDGLFDLTLAEVNSAPDGALVFVNFVDFDQLYGHRRDVAGYAAELEDLDRRLPELLSVLTSGDLVVITADHGCDPTWPGSDHTRENVSVIMFGPDVTAQSLGVRESFADMGQTIAQHLNVAPLPFGKSCL